MSGMKPVPLSQFYRCLHLQGVTVEDLAMLVDSSRAHVTQVLNHTRARTRKNGEESGTWKRLKKHLTPDEIELLNEVPPHVPRRTKFHFQEAA